MSSYFSRQKAWSPVFFLMIGLGGQAAHSAQIPARPVSQNKACSSVAFSPDGKYLAAGFTNTTVRIWDTRKPGEVFSEWPLSDQEKSPGKQVRQVMWLDSKRLAVARQEENIEIWNMQLGEAEQGEEKKEEPSQEEKQKGCRLALTLKGHTAPVTALACLPGKGQIASAAEDQTLRLWEGGEGTQLTETEVMGGYISCLASSPDGNQLAAGLAGFKHGKGVWLYNTGKGWGDTFFIERNTSTTSIQLSDRLLAVSFASMVNNYIAVIRGASSAAEEAQDSRHLNFFTLPEDSKGILDGHTRKVASISLSPDSERLASGSWDKTARLWDIQRPQIIWMARHEHFVMGVSLSPQAPSCLATGDFKGGIHFWDTRKSIEE